MSGENRRIGLFTSVVGRATDHRQRLPLYVQVRGDDLRKALDKGAVRDFHADTDLSHILKPRDLHSNVPDQLRVHYGETKKVQNRKEAEKALPAPKRAPGQTDLPGQQHFMATIGPKDPMTNPLHAMRGKPSEQMHIEAAKHYIQADYHGRHPGGWDQAQAHHKQYANLRSQGAQPTADHFKAAMQELHPKYTQAMKSKNPPLFLKALGGAPEAPKADHGDQPFGVRKWEDYHHQMMGVHAEAAKKAPEGPIKDAHLAAQKAHDKAHLTIRDNIRRSTELGAPHEPNTMKKLSRRAMARSEEAFKVGKE